ncbi:serine hydrolase domain-containing protein [Agromyces humatus]|uniref:Beta-lactamase-related domain-containing protein n=1 Tax=Agromyces humatus TaxID=279573 RepID=A0ABP4WIG6_9MICO|nr:serine hydrolase domain-containing protein [Agromyces humatus]
MTETIRPTRNAPTTYRLGRYVRRSVVALIVVGSLALSACAPSGDTATPSGGAATSSPSGTADGPLEPTTLAKVEQTVQTFQEVTHTPGVLIGIWSPKGTFVSATGVADLETGAPLSTDMQFKVGSQTKAFVANLVLQLVGEGEVSLDDHISKWVADVPNGDAITIRQLLSMKSGLGAGFLAQEANANKLVTSGCTEADRLAAGAAEPALAPPGTEWIYSNYGYDLLGRVVELVTGQDVSTAIHERIAEPLGLDRTLLPTSGNGLSEPFTHGYGTGDVKPAEAAQSPGVAAEDVTAFHQSCLGAEGGMVSTMADLHVWSRALATGALLEPSVWEEAQEGAFPYAFSDDYNGPGRWLQGLGFVESGGFIGKEGSFAGYESITMYSPTLDTTIEVVSTKQPNAITPTRMFQALAMDLYGTDVDFGLTHEEALAPSYTGLPPED